ncbi:MAG: hypothetical protein SF029_07755 [bacterium]|nr:hypothetical protein [bacterium]
MPEERKRLLMQESLDTELPAEVQHELESYLNSEPKEARHYSSLQKVDSMLRTAPFERAPRRLAVTIMARLAETVKEEQETSLSASPELNEAALQVALQLVTVAALPLMVGASWMLLNTMADPAAVEAVFAQVAGLYVLVIDVMKVMLDEAAAVYHSNPEAALALLTLMPVVLLKLVEIVLGEDTDEDTEA